MQMWQSPMLALSADCLIHHAIQPSASFTLLRANAAVADDSSGSVATYIIDQDSR